MLLLLFVVIVHFVFVLCVCVFPYDSLFCLPCSVLSFYLLAIRFTNIIAFSVSHRCAMFHFIANNSIQLLFVCFVDFSVFGFAITHRQLLMSTIFKYKWFLYTFKSSQAAWNMRNIKLHRVNCLRLRRNTTTTPTTTNTQSCNATMYHFGWCCVKLIVCDQQSMVH